MEIDAALEWLRQHINIEAIAAGSREAPSLDRIRQLTGLMADPQRAYPVVHLTGTNGKGSVARMVTALLAAQGLSVGTYTSPHLERLNERISRNAHPISDEELADVLTAVAQLEAASGMQPSHFDVLTAAAFRWFADVAVDVAVVEVGMLGRWDATNVADGAVAVVTNVGLDHTDYSGKRRTDVAREKAGIVKPGSHLVLGETDPELVPIFEAEGPEVTWLRDRDFGAVANRIAVGGRLVDLRTPNGEHEDVLVPLHGAHQGDNAAIALAAAEAFFGGPLDRSVVDEAFASVQVPGRFEVVSRQPLLILDGAHNPDGAAAARATLDEDFEGVTPRVLVVGLFREKDPVEMLEELGARDALLVVACTPPWPRARPAAEVAAAAAELGVDSISVDDVGEAVRRAVELTPEDGLVLVTGSFYVVGAARAALRR